MSRDNHDAENVRQNNGEREREMDCTAPVWRYLYISKGICDVAVNPEQDKRKKHPNVKEGKADGESSRAVVLYALGVEFKTSCAQGWESVHHKKDRLKQHTHH